MQFFTGLRFEVEQVSPGLSAIAELLVPVQLYFHFHINQLLYCTIHDPNSNHKLLKFNQLFAGVPDFIQNSHITF